jgi:hypothetical protein
MARHQRLTATKGSSLLSKLEGSGKDVLQLWEGLTVCLPLLLGHNPANLKFVHWICRLDMLLSKRHTVKERRVVW